MNSIVLQGVIAAITAFILYGLAALPNISKKYGPGFGKYSIWFWGRTLLYTLLAGISPLLLNELEWVIEWHNSNRLFPWLTGIVTGIFVSVIFNRIFSFAIVHDGKVKGALGNKGSLLLSFFDEQIDQEIKGRKNKIIEKHHENLSTSGIDYQNICNKALGLGFDELNDKQFVGEVIEILHTHNTLTTEESQNQGRIKAILKLLLKQVGSKKFKVILNRWYGDIFEQPT